MAVRILVNITEIKTLKGKKVTKHNKFGKYFARSVWLWLRLAEAEMENFPCVHLTACPSIGYSYRPYTQYSDNFQVMYNDYVCGISIKLE